MRSLTHIDYKLRSEESYSAPLPAPIHTIHRIPLYGSPRSPQVSKPHSLRKARASSPRELMTVDYRYDEESEEYRSSFVLSDIFEDDETEIEISPILPSTSSTHRPEGTNRGGMRYKRTLSAWVAVRVKG
ncbi:uncharacterized protein FIBRA_02522 [Fibroporia radiculosa]|uniref:Uncharacterized protein n=1 Tax=Fibroporia radiculosa TaxID=599839 RepID=J4G1S4_9APHY|nr:uncharacterized protein FIBRA_02522 [Fibroporia radiculosa]CCM00488.1 predicted protein [Fibroporia radiculosa]